MQGAAVDDLLILVQVEEVDGPFGILASAGFCDVRQSSGLPAIGFMHFDAADIDRLAASGQLTDLILHEMAHALGFGTAWEQHGLLRNPAPDLQPAPGPDTHFSGARAIGAFDASGGQSRTVGQKVPVENVGRRGSINGHWREATMGHELMTPFLDVGVANPLSIVTIQSLADLGYRVSTESADAYTVPQPNAVAPAAPSRGVVPLIETPSRRPIRVIDDRGRVVRILPPPGR